MMTERRALWFGVSSLTVRAVMYVVVRLALLAGWLIIAFLWIIPLMLLLGLPIWLMAHLIEAIGIAKMFDAKGDLSWRTTGIATLTGLPLLIPFGMLFLEFMRFILAPVYPAVRDIRDIAQKLWRYRTPARLIRRARVEGELIMVADEEKRIREQIESRRLQKELERKNKIEQNNKENKIAQRENREKNVRESGGYARVPKDADDFEEVAAEFARTAGFPDARRTPKGPDGGVDVVAKRMVGQAKFHSSQKVAPSDIRALAGSRQEFGTECALFFHYGPGYSDEAKKTAKRLDVFLYEFVPPGRFRRVY